jgi:hypothetical protein
MAEQDKASEWEQKWSQLVAKVWDDPALKKRLLADPATVLKENGLEMAPGLQVKMVENTPSVVHLILPAKPTSEELSEEELSSVAAGHCHGCRGCRGCGGCHHSRGCEGCRGCRRCDD